MPEDAVIVKQNTPAPEKPNPFFPLVAIAAAAFIVTIFALVATMFGEQQAPVAQFFNQYGTSIILVEVAIIFVTGLTALTVDRRQTLAALRSAEHIQTSPEVSSPKVPSSDAEPG